MKRRYSNQRVTVGMENNRYPLVHFKIVESYQRKEHDGQLSNPRGDAAARPTL